MRVLVVIKELKELKKKEKKKKKKKKRFTRRDSIHRDNKVVAWEFIIFMVL